MTRTADQSAAVLFWNAVTGSGTGPWIQAGIDGALAKNLTTLENARLFASLTTAAADSAIAVWDAKYEYDFWRPITAIRKADLDGNADTIQDIGWGSLIAAPPHQSYVSAHSAISATASGILQGLLGDSGTFCLTSAGATRCWGSYAEAITESSNSRIWGGIHFRFDTDAGLALGGRVASFALARDAFGAVPEASTWMMMIVGFGMAGMAKRRSQRAKFSVRGKLRLNPQKT